MKKNNKTAVVAMSGGIDSSVTALLLQQEGYNVIGVTGKMINSPCADTVCTNAQKVADKLGIELKILDVTQKFQKEVIDYFENSYLNGKTPNPCIVCNQYIKWGEIFNYAINELQAAQKFQKEVIDYFENSYLNGKTPNPCIVCNQYIKWGEIFNYAINELQADIFATGHYADIRCDNGFYKLYPAKDEHKDQLYFLYRLGQKELSKTRFPLYEYEKSQVKQIAIDYDLPPKSSKESQDICFIQKPNTTKKYLIDKFGCIPGDFIELSTGKKLGTHAGHYQYTFNR